MNIETYIMRDIDDTLICVTQYITKSLAEANMLCKTFDTLRIEHEDDELVDDSYCIKIFNPGTIEDI